mmetsp:Transcript_1979/g.2662  ORF Transcript_1979/g.2662 Transcript_1979/m.2662 type:complete len:239 (-) Transcript_1979:497-1213(-)
MKIAMIKRPSLQVQSSEKHDSSKRSSKRNSLFGSMFKPGCPTVRKLVEEEDWETLMKKLDTHTGQSQVKQVDFAGFTILNILCTCSPPTHVVEAVIKLFPEALQSIDLDQRLPLHVACGTGASEEVVKLLVKSYPEAAMAIDDQGRLPLHYAVEYACKNECVNEEKTKEEMNYLGVIKILVETSFQSVYLKDWKGEDALDLVGRIGRRSYYHDIRKVFQEVEEQESQAWTSSDDDEEN